MAEKSEGGFGDFERQSSFFSANDFFVPAATVVAAAYFLTIGNLTLLMLLALLALFVFNAWSGQKTREKYEGTPLLSH